MTTEGCETRWKTEPEPEGLSTGGTEHRLRVHWAGSRAPPAESEMTSREGCQGGASVPGCGVCKSLCVCVMPLLCVLILCLGAFGGRAGPGRAGPERVFPPGDGMYQAAEEHLPVCVFVLREASRGQVAFRS